MEVRRNSPRETLLRSPERYVALGVVLAGGFVQFGAWGGLGLLAVAAACVGGIALHAARSRLHVTPEAITKRGLLRTRTARLTPGTRLVRVANQARQRWGTRADHATVVVTGPGGAALLRWTGLWRVPSEEIARAADLPFDDRLDVPLDGDGRRLLAFPNRRPWVMAVGVVTVVVAVVAVAVVLVLRSQDADRDRAAAATQSGLEAYAVRQSATAASPALSDAWRGVRVSVRRRTDGAYSAQPDRGVDIVVSTRAPVAEGTAAVLCRAIRAEALRARVLQVRTVVVGVGTAC